MASFVAEARDVGVSLRGSPTPPSELGAGISNLLGDVGREYGQLKANEAKQNEKLLTGQSLAAFEEEARNINEGVALGMDNPTIAGARETLSKGEAVIAQSSGRKSDIAAVLLQSRARKYRNEALNTGNLALAEQIEQSFAKYSAVDALGGVVPDIMTRGEIDAEKLQAEMMRMVTKEVADAGMLGYWNASDDKTRATIYSTIEEQKRAAASLKTQVDRMNAEATQLNLTKSQREERNIVTIIPQLEGVRQSGIRLVQNAIKESLAIPVVGQDPELVAAKVRNFRLQFAELKSQLSGAKLPGVETQAESSIQMVNKLEEDAIAALTNSDAAKQFDQLYNVTDKKDSLAVPDEVRKFKQYLPILNTLAQLEESHFIDPEAKYQILDTSTYMVDLLKKGTPGQVNFGRLTEPQTKQALGVTSTVVKNLLDKNKSLLDDPANKESVNAAIAYVVGTGNQFQLNQDQTPTWYGDFLVDLFSNKGVYDELSKNPLMGDTRNKAFLLAGMQTYKDQLYQAIDEDMKGSAGTYSDQREGRSAPINSLVAMTKSQDGVVFTPMVTSGPMAPIARTEAARLQAKYGVRYRNTEMAFKNVTGLSPTQLKEEQAKALPTPAAPVGQPDELMSLVSKLSAEDKQALLESLR